MKLRIEDLEGDKFARILNGSRHGVNVTVFVVDYPESGMGPRLHCHPYTEIFVIQGGAANFRLGDAAFEVGPGEVLIATENVPHGFSSIGSLKLFSVQTSAVRSTTWLE